MSDDIVYKRILLKISGESLSDESTRFGLGMGVIGRIAKDVVELYNHGIDVSLVVGGGNILRGAALANAGVERAVADYMGMLATLINALAIQNAIEKHDVVCRVLSAVPMHTVCEPYIRRRALHHISKRRIVIFAAGTGNPFFSTDTAAVLRAIEMECDVILKGTQVDGVYSADPKSTKEASRFDVITYKDVMSMELNVMDSAAIALAKDNGMPIVVFRLHEVGNLMQVVRKRGKYTIIS